MRDKIKRLCIDKRCGVVTYWMWDALDNADIPAAEIGSIERPLIVWRCANCGTCVPRYQDDENIQAYNKLLEQGAR